MSARVSHGMRRQPNDPPCECSRCNAPATMTEWSPLPTGSTAFYSYCSRCWHEPGPNAPSPAHRTGTAAQFDANELRVGDTIKVWWHPHADRITRLEPYTGPLECLRGARLATFALLRNGMTLEPGSTYELAD